MKHKLILDVDPGIDDSLAIMFASANRNIDLLGCTIVCGNVDVHKGSTNALHALEAVGDGVTPVFLGQNEPLEKEYISAEDTHGDDGIGGLNRPSPTRKPDSIHAVDFLLDKMREHPGEIDLVALGPLTNVATAITRDPEAFRKLRHLYIMGGTARYPGNCSPVAEYNFWVDPHAAHLVLTSGLVDVTMIGLDVTHSIVLTPNLREIIRLFETPAAEHLYAITDFYTKFHWLQERTIGCVINDPLVPAVVIETDLIKTRRAYVEVVTEGIAEGQSLVDFDGFWHDGDTLASVALQVHGRRFFDTFLRTLFPQNTAEIDLLLEKEFVHLDGYLA